MRRESIHDVNIPAGMTEKSRGSMTKDDGLDLAASRSIDEVQAIEMQEGKHGQFHRSFTPRQVHIIALGSNIGSGVFIATGKALATGGPGNMVIAYFMVCTCVWAVLQSLSEMTIAFPVSGNYIDYADRWVDPALAFGAGFAEWLGWTAIVSAEAGFFHILVGYWSGGSFPLAASLSIFMFACLVIFLLPNTVFAWFEYVTSLIKIFLFLIIITLSLALVLGAGPNGYVHHGETWTELPAFLNGFSGFANCALLATWAVGDQVFIGIMGGGVAASPFVIAVTDSGIPGISSLLNAGMICGVLAIAAESVYLSSRVLRTMAHQGLISTRLAHVDDKGRPRLALIITSVVAVVLGYIQLSSGGLTVLNWLISITSASFFTNWIIISFTNYRFHCALKAQNDKLFSETYAWRSSAWPIAPAWLMLISLMLLVCCIYSGINPVGGAGFSASNFFQYMIGVLVIFGFTAGYKVIFRTPWRDPATADCLTGRRHLSVEEIKHLDEYYAKPKWRRFLTYVQLW
ncbi:hypothetical protein QSH57_014133 [Fusarium oxysporum f. sp. vasinfectum]|nr:hypothetical protein QSH57_014133 [Fusarium oxysporum f. sp. vasinfectum]